MCRELSKERRLKPTSFGVGFLGIGKHKTRMFGNRTKASVAWGNMLSRCYNEKELLRNPSYNDCTVCDEWLNFQNFAGWYYKNLPSKDFKYQLDKDILIKGNKIYSPDTCCFVPARINSLLTNSKEVRGDLPIGVTRNTGRFIKEYKSRCSYKNKRINLGVFDTPEEAFNAYKDYKERIIKSIANKYFNRHKISFNTYNALMNYEIETTD